MSGYHVAFDVRSQGVGPFLFPACYLVLAMVLAVLSRLRVLDVAQKGLVSVSAILGIGGVFACAIVGAERRSLANALENGSAVVYEGRIERFVDGDGHAPDELWVGWKHLEYYEATFSAAYHKPRIRGGVLRQGLWVRIHTVNDRIARIEVRHDTT